MIDEEKRELRNARKRKTNREWRRRNSEKVRSQKRDAYKRQIKNETLEQRKERLAKQRGRSACCRKKHREKYRVASREAMRKRRAENPKAVREYEREYRQKNREKVNARKRAAAAKQLAENPEAVRAKAREYSPRYSEARLKYQRRKRKESVQWKLSMNLRTRLNAALRRNFKAGSAVRDLGCTIDELKSYLEAQFAEGMSWDNWALDGWHLDHIRPLASFNLADRDQLLTACHYTNLQPLWAKENLRKGARCPDTSWI